MRYLRDTMTELRRVRWPTLDEAWHLTKIVMLVTVAMALLLSILDFLFAKELEGIITGNAIAIGVLVVALVVAVVVGVILSQQKTRTV